MKILQNYFMVLFVYILSIISSLSFAEYVETNNLIFINYLQKLFNKSMRKENHRLEKMRKKTRNYFNEKIKRDNQNRYQGIKHCNYHLLNTKSSFGFGTIRTHWEWRGIKELLLLFMSSLNLTHPFEDLKLENRIITSTQGMRLRERLCKMI